MSGFWAAFRVVFHTLVHLGHRPCWVWLPYEGSRKQHFCDCGYQTEHLSAEERAMAQRCGFLRRPTP